jgi:hypothetical protein
MTIDDWVAIQGGGREEAERIKKGQLAMAYVPTQLPVQYHRRCVGAMCSCATHRQRHGFGKGPGVTPPL